MNDKEWYAVIDIRDEDSNMKPIANTLYSFSRMATLSGKKRLT